MKARYLYSLSDSSIDVRGGNKAKNLRYLMKHKYPVPKGFVLVYDALEQYENDPEAVLMHVWKELIENLHPELSYAARSSASLEDLGDFPAQEHLMRKSSSLRLSLYHMDFIFAGISVVAQSE